LPVWGARIRDSLDPGVPGSLVGDDWTDPWGQVSVTDNGSAQRHDLPRPWSVSDRAVPRMVVRPLQRVLHTESASGIVLLMAAVMALIWANSPWAHVYNAIWETPLTVRVGGFELSEDLRHWVNDLLMALFFFVVGLEVKREIVHGDLRDLRTALLPIAGALGGMVVPAALYLTLNPSGPAARGWGIPIATDIAFAVGILALLGHRAAAGLRVFLLTLAIVDDIGAILVIAVFYTSYLSLAWLLVAAATVGAVIVMERVHVRALWPYVFAAVVLWLAVFESGVHATIAGVILGLLTPAWSFHPLERVTEPIDAQLGAVRALPPDGQADEGEQAALMAVTRLANEAISPLARLQTALHPWSALVVLPLFALANAGVALSGEALRQSLSNPITIGIIVGLVVGKPAGIVSAALIAVHSGRARMPESVNWVQLVGVAALGGVGFTVSIFIAGLAFSAPEAVDAAKIGILIASALAGLIGAFTLLAKTEPLAEESERVQQASPSGAAETDG
jgi:NhaA family Na+:H+ antiporter